VRDTGVQFVVHSFTPVVMPSLMGDLYDDPAGEVFWSAVRADIQKVFPTAPSTFPTPEQRRVRTDWLMHAAYMYAPTDAVFVWSLKSGPADILGNPGGNAHYSFTSGPNQYRAIALADSVLGGNSFTLAHELGHHFGLTHVDGYGGIDPATGLPTTPADCWEFFYKPGTTTTPHTFFASKAEALPHVGQVQPISRWDTYDATFLPTPAPPPPPTIRACSIAGGTVTCNVARCACPVGYGCGTADNDCHAPPPITTIRTELHDHAGAVLQRGLALTTNWPGQPRGVNLMSYMGLGGIVPTGFANSQIGIVRRQFEFDVAADADLSGHLTGSGKRPRLGQRRPMSPLARVDFDNDGRRDIAFWIPPADATSTGEFRVLLSSTSYAAGSAMVVTGFGKLGDVPVLADYNGDGRTDLAVYRPGGASPTGALTDASQWIWCPTAAVPTATSCASVTTRSFGTRAQTPLPGLNFGASGPYLAVHDATTHTWKWRTASCTGSAVVCDTTVVSGTGLGGEPLPGLFDGDDLTDLVSYDPVLATFTVRWSTGGYATDATRPFAFGFRTQTSGSATTRSGARVVRGLTSTFAINGSPPYQWRQREALALWDPYLGNWQVDWTPHLTPSVPSTLCQWGTNGDIPLGGLGVKLQPSPLTQLGGVPSSRQATATRRQAA
jgi:hypothetical protein